MKQSFLCLLLLLCLLAGGCGVLAPALQDGPLAAQEQPIEQLPQREEEAASDFVLSKPVLYCAAASYTVNSVQIQFYFSQQYMNALNTYGELAFDPEQPLIDQPYDDTQSWEEFLFSQAMAQAEQTAQLCLAARAEGFTLPPEKSLGDLEATTAEAAKKAGCVDSSGEGNVEAYLNACYGDGATFAGYQKFMEDTALASAYTDYLTNAPEYTDEILSAVYDNYSESYIETFHILKDDTRQMDIRLIRFYPDNLDSEDDWAAAELRAKAVQEEFQASPSDETFAALSQKYTEEFHAPEGGLYTQVEPGIMSEAINAWLYPESGARSSGDCTLLREEDACTLVYVSALSDRPFWMIVVDRDLRYSEYRAKLDEIQAQYEFTYSPENVDLRVPTAHTAKDKIPDGVEAVG